MSAASPNSFDTFFRAATGNRPYDYQRRLAERDSFPELLDVPTGLGKTAAVVLGWLWRRVGNPLKTPRRLVYCLPMRTLVEQTAEAARGWIENLQRRHPLPGPCRVHVLMGGEEPGGWDLRPECDAVLVGTQDMLLSRLLNRGYGMSRYRWPMHFGLLGNDCLWVMDEVQLMGSGLATSVQIDGFQKCFWKPALPCHFLWMSATVGGSLLATTDRVDAGIGEFDEKRCLRFDPAKEAAAVRARVAAPKLIEIETAAPPLAKILDQHRPGRMSLVILNTVPAAQRLFCDLVTTLDGGKGQRPETVLLHGRFRPPDRERQMAKLREFVERQKETGEAEGLPGIIVVSTQVVEAGLDISSVRLWSEIAPWASVVQRLGRLNREDKQPEARATFWMPRRSKERECEENEEGAPNESRKGSELIGPYREADLKTATTLLGRVRDAMAEGAAYRAALDAILTTPDSEDALKINYDAVIRPHDFLELFETEPDLAGGFTDISRFVRDQDRNVDAHVFWREDEPEPGEPTPSAEELCPVPFYSLQKFLSRAKGPNRTAREWNAEEGNWAARRHNEVRPGMTLRLCRKQGGYRDDLGWTEDSCHFPTAVPPSPSPPGGLADDQPGGGISWVSLGDHTADVLAATEELVRAFGWTEEPEGKALVEAARWHDVGKASPRWGRSIVSLLGHLAEKVERGRRETSDPLVGRLLEEFGGSLAMPGGGPWAKFPDARWVWTNEGLTDEQRRHLRRRLFVWFRPGYRHEAASAMVAWGAWQEKSRPHLTGLAVYLVACHHGKVRTVLRSIRRDDALFGVLEGEILPAVGGILASPAPVPTAPRRFGATGTWDDAAGTFTLESPSWSSLLGDLLGEFPVLPPCLGAASAAQDDASVPQEQDEGSNEQRPAALGPFKLAFLETLLRVADERASGRPGMGRGR